MIKFAYINVKNASTSHILFEFHFSYYLRVLFEENIDFYSRFCYADELAEKLRELIKVCC